MVLECELVQGTVVVGVHHALPMDGVEMILGNDLTGGDVWANVPPPPLDTAGPLTAGARDDCGQRFPEVFPQGRVVASPDSRESGGNRECEFVVPLPDLPPSVSREEWVESQQSDPTLSALLDGVLPEDKVQEVAHGYFLQKGLLACWLAWVPCEGDFVGEPLFQVVAP